MEAPLPHKISLVQETARVISERIRTGEWREQLPGERYLSKILEVGRDTVRKALVALEAQGLISAPNKGKKRFILKSGATSGEQHSKHGHTFTVGYLSSVSLEKMLPGTLLEIHRIEESLSAKNASLRVVSGSWAAKGSPENYLKDLFNREKCNLWILYRTSRETQNWFEKNNIPCLIRGVVHEGISLPQLDTNWQATAQHASATLWREGHRHVAIIAPEQPLRGILEACKGVRNFPENDWHTHVISDPVNREGLIRQFEHFRKEHPEVTALITTRPRQLLTFMTWAASQGLKIPDDISLISLAYESYLDELWPAIHHYKIDPEQVSRRIVKALSRLINGASLSHNSEWLIPDHYAGLSIKTVK